MHNMENIMNTLTPKPPFDPKRKNNVTPIKWSQVNTNKATKLKVK